MPSPLAWSPSDRDLAQHDEGDAASEVTPQGGLVAWTVQQDGGSAYRPWGEVRKPVFGPKGPGLLYLPAGHGVPRGGSGRITGLLFGLFLLEHAESLRAGRGGLAIWALRMMLDPSSVWT